jgi:hypothetical protein
MKKIPGNDNFFFVKKLKAKRSQLLFSLHKRSHTAHNEWKENGARGSRDTKRLIKQENKKTKKRKTKLPRPLAPLCTTITTTTAVSRRPSGGRRKKGRSRPKTRPHLLMKKII